MTDQPANNKPADNAPPADNKPAGDTPPADNAQKPADNPDNGKPAPDAATELYKPEGIAEHFLGKDNKETIDKLTAAVAGFRKDLSKKDVPENADGYTLELPDDIKAKVIKPGEDGKDPLLEKMKPILHKHHIPKAAFQEIATQFYNEVAAIADGATTKPDGTPLADFEFKELGGVDKAKPLIEGTEVWIKGLEQSQKISAKAAEELKIMAGYGEGLATLMELRAAMGEKPIPKNLEGTAPDGITEAMIMERWADPRSWQMGAMDDAFIAETRAMQRKLDAA